MRFVLAFFVFTSLAGASRDDVVRILRESPDETELLAAIGDARSYADPDVINLVAQKTRSKSLSVRAAAIDALGRIKHDDALSALHALYRRDKRLAKNEDAFALLLRSIGRHGDIASLPILTGHAHKNLTVKSGTARILGVANIRDNASVEALIRGWRRISGRSRRGVDNKYRGHFQKCFQLALTCLTGQDLGASQSAWAAWWRQNRGTFKVALARPGIDAELVEMWEKYWGDSYSTGQSVPPSLQRPFEMVMDPDRTAVAWAVQGLMQSYKTGNDAEIVAAIENNAGIRHDKVTYQIARGLRSRSVTVQLSAIHTLGWTTDRSALKQLHRMYRREKSLRGDEDVFADLLKAIGRHSDASSLTVLASDPFKRLTLASGRARIYGIARIRSKKSVETLIKAMRLGGGSRGRKAGEPRFMGAFRLAMAVLTGHDAGESKEAWQEWWKENKDSFRMDSARPNIREALKKRWEAYWREPY